ncbi:MAG TPA: electron transfer flavoprotein subunit alpha/FixB family protein [Ktedonobacteraceae bacterium]|nr:electron transfer flavoprotein subunit alpha/FixB family protein [Ktedonobacteraceae bacterium]
MSEIWAVLEYDGIAFHENSDELLAELVEIARKHQQEKVCAVILIAPGMPLPDTTYLANPGMHNLYVLEHPLLAQYTTGGYVSALAWLIEQQHPSLVLASDTLYGRDWIPRLAARLHLPFVSGCLGVELHNDSLLALRSVYEGRAYVQTRTELHGKTGLATLVPGVRGTPVKNEQGASQTLAIKREIPEIVVGPGQERIRRLALQAPSPEEIELDAAERIVAGGRGVGQEGFRHIADFARMIGAAVGATRVATDRGWVEQARQIGATGKSVHPKLYIACGISGAAQHISGMREAQTVVAINPDRTAPIFALADLGLLGDASQVLLLTADMLQSQRVEPS